MRIKPEGDPLFTCKVIPSEFDEAYYDTHRGMYGGRSHNILANLEISIDCNLIESDNKTVSGVINSFIRIMKNNDPIIAYRIEKELYKNLVRIDLIYNICCILNDSAWKDRVRFEFDIYGQKKEDILGKTDTDGFVVNDNFFYRMTKHWVISDHYNPTIRSEMIWDMLLSDFICDLMRKKYDTRGKRKEVLMLAKEFPYSKKPYNKQEKILKGPKVDYLIGIGDILYFVELKTDLGSFNTTQYESYRKYVENVPGFSVSDLWDRYNEIIKKAGRSKNYFGYTGTEKYRYQLDRMKKECKMEEEDDETFIHIIKGKYKKIKITYITFDKIDQLKKDEQIVLRNGEDDNLAIFTPEDEDDDTKRQRWIMVMEIIREVMRGDFPEPIVPE